MRESVIGYVKILIGWAMTIIPAWMDELNTVVGAASAVIGLIGLIWTTRNQIVKYRMNRITLKKMEDEANGKFRA